jgi:hypothetical protein
LLLVLLFSSSSSSSTINSMESDPLSEASAWRSHLQLKKLRVRLHLKLQPRASLQSILFEAVLSAGEIESCRELDRALQYLWYQHLFMSLSWTHIPSCAYSWY